MANVRTVEQLEAALTEELKWRTHEVVQWESVAAGVRDYQLPAVVRGGIALLYGHWEGYVKAAGCLYLEHVSRKGLKIDELRAELAAVSMRTLLGKGESSKSSTQHTEIILAIREGGGELARIPFDRSTIRTRSNLSFEVFEDIMHSIGCDASRHEIHRSLINNRLLKNRNDIAHGRELYVLLDDWRDIRHRVFEMLVDVRTQLANSAATESYRRVVRA
ncbi:MAE_28990/MAE_18760 family HEPN-like nuclease [Dactylosporangium sucinum]|uniref:MAE-28990/MAE-18760-like HEPN domain-containing protein n=1 Tax=Dactylosporangium sucinum TaxID=1424081 RepID=A0A917TZ12_9ACTN|nr:MAE_28990/MAE_18760 family HEPN-like nuclease [Dactylosporangium sucinum]GGM43991.1 hypothetical protein GCM10007977_051970 [Dactylosporangium sucinum]